MGSWFSSTPRWIREPITKSVWNASPKRKQITPPKKKSPRKTTITPDEIVMKRNLQKWNASPMRYSPIQKIRPMPIHLLGYKPMPESNWRLGSAGKRRRRQTKTKKKCKC